MDITGEEKCDLLEKLYNIEAIASMMEKAFERLDTGNEGVYGCACLIRREAEGIRKMMGEF